MSWDVLIYDDKNAWAPAANASGRSGQGVGGFEVQMVQIATWLASRGLKVAAFNAGGWRVAENGVEYFPHMGGWGEQKCKTLLTCRSSQIPTWVTAERTVTSCVDDPRWSGDDYEHLLGRTLMVHLSHWQKSLYVALHHRANEVIPSMLDDAIYDGFVYHDETLKSGWVCVNAWNKGTDETLDLWARLSRRYYPDLGTLSVGSPYGAPPDALERCHRAGASWLGQLTPKQIVRALGSARGVFRVCKRPETFGVTDAIAEALGTHVHCLCTNGFGAAKSVLVSPYVTDSAEDFEGGVVTRATHYQDEGRMPKPKDYRVSTVMPQWLEVLGLS